MKGNLKQALVHESIEPNELWNIRIAYVHYRVLPMARNAVLGFPEIHAKDEGIYKGCEKGKN